MRWRLLILLGLAASLAACAGGSARGGAKREATSTSSAAALPSGSRLLLDVPEPLSAGYAAGGSLYYVDASPLGEHTGAIYRMTRVDAISGRVDATRRFSSALDSTLLAGGSPWVTTHAGDLTSLWRLDPRSLAVRSKQSVPSSGDNQGITGSLAAAGGQLWVGTGMIDRVSLTTGRVDRVVDPSHPGPVQLAADGTGRILLASLGYANPTYIARLDPRSGATISDVTIPHSVAQPALGGIIDGGAWIENTVGTKTTAWRINVNTLQATKTTAQTATADATSVYYTDVPVNGHAVKLETAPISRDCTS